MAGDLFNIGGGVLTENPSGLILPIVTDITRNSANDGTDALDTVLGTFVIPANVLRLGSIITNYVMIEISNSASTKTISLKLNGTFHASAVVTTSSTILINYPVHLYDATTILSASSLTSGGGVASVNTPNSATVANAITNGVTVTITGKWGGATLSEFIRLKFGKIVITY